MFESLKLSDIPKQQCGILRKPSSTRSVIWLIEENGIVAAVKDFSFNGFVFRNSIGRLLIWREKKAYERLKGLKGVPELYGSIGGLALIIEHIPGKNIEPIEIVKNLSDTFFKELKDLVDNFHNLGIVHCDMKRAPNIILGDDGKPYIIDWAASISRDEFRFFPLNRIYKRFIRDDLNAIIKIRLKKNPENVSPEEKEQYNYRSLPERIIRAFKNKSRAFLKKVA